MYVTKKTLQRILALQLIGLSIGVNAAEQTYPGVTPPYTLAGGDNLTISSGNMQYTGSLGYTVQFSTTSLGDSTITVNSGTTLSYAGTNSVGSAILSNLNNIATGIDYTITNNGTISSNTSLGVYVTNSFGATADNTLTINNAGTITGGILTSGLKTVSLNVSGTSNSISGSITLGVRSGGTSNLTVATNATFAPNEISDITNLIVQSGATLTLDYTTADITNFTVNSSGTANINIALEGSGGAIINSGTMNIAADISKTGTFTATGTNVVSQAVTVATSSYDLSSGTHQAYMYDEGNYGSMTLSVANLNSIDQFDVTYGNGYLAGGTYTLATGQSAISNTPTFSAPSSTIYLSFGTPYVSGNDILIDISRTPFNTLVTSTLAQAIGSTLETLGNSSPSSSVLTLLDALEASPNSAALQFNLLQLGPLTTAPIQGLTLQNTCMEQAQLRLASLRDNHYYAGDLTKDNNMWLRGFGQRANQQAKQDSFGYYASSGGVAVGYDREFDIKYNLGVALAYVNSNVDDKINPNSSTNIKSYMGMMYGNYNFDAHEYMEWVIGVIGNRYTAQRIVNINGMFSTASSTYDTQQASAKILWGKTIGAYGFIQATPMASMQYTFVKEYDYVENNAGAANLNIEMRNDNLLQLGIGGKVAIPLLIDPSIMMPEVYAMYLYNVINPEQNAYFSFQAGGNQMISTFTLSRSMLDLGFSFTVAVLDNLELKFNYDVQFADRYTNQGIFLDLRYSL